MSRVFVLVTFVTLLLSSCADQAEQSSESAYVAEKESDHSLVEIMQALETDLAEVAHGIWTQDFTIMAAAATRIANHPKVSAEQLSVIKAELGEEIGAFVQFDQIVHSSAVELADSASENANIADLFRIYHTIETGCYSCHAAFQERVSGVLSASQ